MKNSYADLRRLIASTKPSKGLLIVALLLALAEVGGTLWFPLLTGELVDKLGSGEDVTQLVWLLGSALVALAIAGGLGRYFLAKVGQDVVKGLQKRITAKLVHQPISFFDKQASGELASRVVNDAGVISSLITEQAVNLISGIMLLVGSAIVLWVLDVKLTLVLFGLIFVAFLFTLPIVMKMEAIGRETQDKTASLTGILTQVFAEMRLVKAFLAENREQERCGKEISALYKLGLRAARINVALEPIMSLALTFSLISILGYGGMRVASGDLSVGTLTAFILYIFNVVVPLVQLSGFVAELQAAKGASERIIRILDSDEEEVQTGRLEPVIEGAIEFEEVTFSYGENGAPVLDCLNLAFDVGSTTALVGASGSGKSTVLSLLERFYEPQQGQILVGGIPISDMSLKAWRSQLGFVPQSAPVMPGTIRENICYGLERDVSDEEIRKAAEAAHCLEFIDSLESGFETDVSEQGSNISGGQRQRLAIARMFLKDPAVLILDEATSSLDSETEHAVKESLAALMKGRTNIVVAHRLSTIRDADRIFVLEAGIKSGEGTHEELVKNHPLYSRLVARQFAA